MIIDGEKLARQQEQKLKKQLAELKNQGIIPSLAVIVIKGDSGGSLYAQLKQKAAQRLGIKFDRFEFDWRETGRIKRLIRRLNEEAAVQGIMIQRPGAAWGKKQGMERTEFEDWWRQLCELIVPAKDVDGLRSGSPFVPATVKAVAAILEVQKIKDKKIIVVGSHGMVGKALAIRLGAEGIDLETKVRRLADKTKKADVLISATGKPGLITAAMVKEGAVVIDVGWPKGDVEFKSVKTKVAAITPVPGGVGPLTVVCLLDNVVKACQMVYSNSL